MIVIILIAAWVLSRQINDKGEFEFRKRKKIDGD